MSHNSLNNLSESTSNTPHAPSLTDLTALAVTLQEVVQTLLKYSQTDRSDVLEQIMPETIMPETIMPETIMPKEITPKIIMPEEITPEQSQPIQCPNSQNPSTSKPKPSRREQLNELYKEFHCGSLDTTAFADKELATLFEQAYAHGNFHDEIRYYYVPASIVRYERKLLCLHQQKDILSLLAAVYNELDLRSKRISSLSKETSSQNTLAQLDESIAQPLQILQTIHSHLNSLKLVHKTMIPRRHRV